MKGRGNRYYSSPLCPQLASSLQAANLAKVCTGCSWPQPGQRPEIFKGMGTWSVSKAPIPLNILDVVTLEILLLFPSMNWRTRIMNYNSLSCQKLKPAAWLHFLSNAIYIPITITPFTITGRFLFSQVKSCCSTGKTVPKHTVIKLLTWLTDLTRTELVIYFLFQIHYTQFQWVHFNFAVII